MAQGRSRVQNLEIALREAALRERYGGEGHSYLLARLREEIVDLLLLAQNDWLETAEWWREYLYKEGPPAIDLRLQAAAEYRSVLSLLELADSMLSVATKARLAKVERVPASRRRDLTLGGKKGEGKTVQTRARARKRRKSRKTQE